VVPLIQRNIDLNIPSSSQQPPAAARAAGYAWGESKAALGAEAFDVILMADVVYDPKYYSALVQALRDLSHAGTVVTLAHRERHPDAALFFEVGGCLGGCLLCGVCLIVCART
jgi:predicted nicotinamide N-methyase